MNRSEAAAATRAASLPAAKKIVLGGWGRFPLCESEVYRPEKVSELAAVVAANSHSLIARGAGRAYGDAALNAQGRVADLQRLNRMLQFDPEGAVVTAEAGVTLGEIIEVFLPRGYFPFVVPGTQFVTVGGAIAADIHGKSHHRDSSFVTHVLWFDLMLASGEIVRCSREENADLFRATAGGMGLTGVIVQAAFRMRRVESAYLHGELTRVRNLDEALEKFESADAAYGHSVAWIDCLSRKGALGRSVLNAANFAALDALAPKYRQDPLRVRSHALAAVPFNLPNFALSPLSVRIFNDAYYRIHRERARATFDYRSFFFPLDALSDWNRIYGRRGFVQYQCVWPLGESRGGLIEVLEAIGASRRASFLAVLKKFGAQEGMLSFPMPGYTLALDFPLGAGLLALLDRLDEMVVKRGGRVYLAKDARMRPEMLGAMYPRLGEWQSIKRGADPDHRFSSTLSRRLGMEPMDRSNPREEN